MSSLLEITDRLRRELDNLRFSSPAAYVYNPLGYAREAHEQYLRRYGQGDKEAVFLGMNPGPWGMAQTGVPFGEVSAVRDWLKIVAPVQKPPQEHPRKMVTGFSCHRSEVSGRRLWGLIRDRFGSPELFFDRFFVVNYCPLLFLDEEGRNVTPERLRPVERRALGEVCDTALRRMMECIRPACVVGIGNFAAEQARTALEGEPIRIVKILHPSPSNPEANRCWAERVLVQLGDAAIDFQARGEIEAH